MSAFDLLVLSLIVGAVLGATPLLVGMYTSLVAGSYGKGGKTSHVVANTAGFMLGLLVTVAALGVSFWTLLSSVGDPTALYICLVVGVLAIASGIVSIRHYFWPEHGIAHRPHARIAKTAHDKTTSKISFVGSLSLGMIAVVGSYVSVALSTILISCIIYVSNVTSPAAWISAYALALLFTVLCIAISIVYGLRISAVSKWRVDSEPLMQLGSGLIIIIAAWVLLLIINTTLVVGGA
jgi:hypothetical protein